MFIAVAIVAAALRLLDVTSKPPVQVQGTIVSQHLGLQFVLAEPWMHAPDLDRDESREGWQSVWSVYFRGHAARDFDDQLTVKVFSKADHGPVTADEVEAAHGLHQAVDGRKCRDQDDMIVCEGRFTHLNGQGYHHEEMYFELDDTRVASLRAMFRDVGDSKLRPREAFDIAATVELAASP